MKIFKKCLIAFLSSSGILFADNSIIVDAKSIEALQLKVTSGYWDDSSVWDTLNVAKSTKSQDGDIEIYDGTTPYPSRNGSFKKPPYAAMEQSHTVKPTDSVHFPIIPPLEVSESNPSPLYLRGGKDEDGVKKIAIPGFQVHLASSNSLYSTSSCNLFEIQADFEKTGKVTDTGTAWIGQSAWNANYAIASASANEPLEVCILRTARLEDVAQNRTSFTSFGGNDGEGVFSADRCLKAFFAKNIRIQNQYVYIATLPTVSSAVISDKLIFESPINGRQGVLVLNCDNGASVSHQSQTVRVGSINGANGNGVITTRTGSQNWNEIDPLSAEGETATPNQLMGRSLSGDSIVRDGILEIFSDDQSSEAITAEFSGEIRDNLSSEHTRGRVSLIMNSPNLTQTLSGTNSFTGYTKVLNGTLKMNMSGYSGDVTIQGGTLQILSPNPTINNLNWSSGGFLIDLSSHTPIALSGTTSVSTMPQAADAFNFANITPGQFTIFTYSGSSSPFSAFANQSVDYTWNNKTYTGTFSVVSNALKITFVEK